MNKTTSAFFIAIDGPAGAGKTTLSTQLANMLNAEVIHTDDFANWYNTFDWHGKIIEQVFEPIVSGAKTIQYSKNNWWNEPEKNLYKIQPVRPIMIIEGAGSLRAELRKHIKFGIFIDAPVAECHRRGIERDKKLNPHKQHEVERLWQQWVADENKYMQEHSPKKSADIVIDGRLPTDKQALQITSLLRKQQL